MMLPMMRNQTGKSWRSAEPWLLGSMVLALAMATRGQMETVRLSGNAGPGATLHFTPPWHRKDST